MGEGFPKPSPFPPLCILEHGTSGSSSPEEACRLSGRIKARSLHAKFYALGVYSSLFQLAHTLGSKGVWLEERINMEEEDMDLMTMEGSEEQGISKVVSEHKRDFGEMSLNLKSFSLGLRSPIVGDCGSYEHSVRISLNFKVVKMASWVELYAYFR